ncbi:hypothetical protein ACH4JS_31000 [Streptomyces sp. NPDC017638]|uniref:hypothetical protein n=1 Tax=Streptomyces sp. NPDC017638 TaxID=3365004 RepID=UPI0037B29FA7
MVTGSVAPEEAVGHFTWLGRFLGLDPAASSTRTREPVGWQPVHPGLLADLGEGHCSEVPAGAVRPARQR